jgi:hypothetical protein
MDEGEILCINEDTILMCESNGLMVYMDYEEFLKIEKEEEYEQALREKEALKCSLFD